MKSNALSNFYNSFKLRYFWIFFTEKCNLNCRYCFYKYRNNRTTFPISKIKKMIDLLPYNNATTEFVISGGEPLLEWEISKEIIDAAREKYEKAYILLQTNAILLNKNIVVYLKDKRVNVEIGLDGHFQSNATARNGTDKNKYQKIVESLKLLEREKIPFSCTMTVYPSQVYMMLENYISLLQQGFNAVEITPAAFVDWKKENVAGFKKGYLKCLDYSIRNGLSQKLSSEYDKDILPSSDAVITAHGEVLPNWALLSLSPKKKIEYAIAYMQDKDVLAKNKKIGFYKELLKDFYAKKRTYREYSTLFCSIVYRESGINFFKGYQELNDFLKRVNRKYLLRICG